MNWKAFWMARFRWFAFGTLGFYALRLGIVPWREAACRGLIVSLIAFLVDSACQVFAFPIWKWSVRSAVLAMLAFLTPLIASLHPLHTVPKRTPEAFGLIFEDVRFATADGTNLAGWVIPAERARGNVIFCHGHGRNRGHVAGLLPTLHELGLNVLVFDFRGHGNSDGHISTFGQREVGDLLAAAHFLRQRFPSQPLFLVGVSLGAAVSLQALPLLPDVRGIWSEGAFARFSEVAANQFRMVPAQMRGILMQSYYGVGWLDCRFWGPAISPADCLATGSVPIFFCHGCNDKLVPLSQGQALFDRYPGPKENWWVEGASHYNVRQKNHEEYRTRLRDFLEKCLREPMKSPQKYGTSSISCVNGDVPIYLGP